MKSPIHFGPADGEGPMKPPIHFGPADDVPLAEFLGNLTLEGRERYARTLDARLKVLQFELGEFKVYREAVHRLNRDRPGPPGKPAGEGGRA